MTPAPAVRLKSGLIVANFSSPHVYNFDDGCVLGRCEPDRVEGGSVDNRRNISEGPKGSKLIRLSPTITHSFSRMLRELEDDDSIDLVLVSTYVARTIACLGFKKPCVSMMVDKSKLIVSATQFIVDR